MQAKKVIVLGSTGSIGTQALEVIGNNPERFELVVSPQS
jgi:1-deoxy-D-xylulose 5-phosphate reductoisomerase